MEAEKSILELYEIVLDHFKNKKQSLFICHCSNRCLTEQEQERFLEHFYTQRPSEIQYTEFYNEPCFRKTRCNKASWFEYPYELYSMGGCYGTLPFKLRIKLLEAIIKNLKKSKK